GHWHTAARCGRRGRQQRLLHCMRVAACPGAGNTEPSDAIAWRAVERRLTVEWRMWYRWTALLCRETACRLPRECAVDGVAWSQGGAERWVWVCPSSVGSCAAMRPPAALWR